MKRRGLGKGLGKGYKNLVTRDPMVHSLSAYGIKQKDDEPLRIAKNPISKLSGSYVPTDFGRIPTGRKRGIIKEIARKLKQGVKWAIEWERQHLPKQKEWVKKEFDKAKEILKHGNDLEQKHQDLADVRDELDTDDDGVQDIHYDELMSTNAEIIKQLDTIDLDKSGTPDYIEDESLLMNVPKEKDEHFSLPVPTFTLKQKETKEGVAGLIEKHRQQVRERRTTMEKLNDAQLREMAVRNKDSTFFGNNYEKEYFRRLKRRKEIADKENVERSALKNMPKSLTSLKDFIGLK